MVGPGGQPSARNEIDKENKENDYLYWALFILGICTIAGAGYWYFYSGSNSDPGQPKTLDELIKSSPIIEPLTAVELAIKEAEEQISVTKSIILGHIKEIESVEDFASRLEASQMGNIGEQLETSRALVTELTRAVEMHENTLARLQISQANAIAIKKISKIPSIIDKTPELRVELAEGEALSAKLDAKHTSDMEKLTVYAGTVGKTNSGDLIPKASASNTIVSDIDNTNLNIRNTLSPDSPISTDGSITPRASAYNTPISNIEPLPSASNSPILNMPGTFRASR